MATRFRRTVKLFPGVKLNIGKNGISTSIGVRGAHMTFGKSGVYIGTGIPGTGISQRTKLSGPIHENAFPVSDSLIQTSEGTNQGKHYKLGVAFWLIFGTLILTLFQTPKLLAFYWLFMAAFAIIRFMIRAMSRKGTAPNANLIDK